MARLKGQEQAVRREVLDMSWKYLHDNFHKFTEANKVKVSLTLCGKDIPQEIDGMNLQQIVMMGDIKKGDEPLRFNIGEKADDANPA